MMHPATDVRFISAALGRGVIATAPLPRGTVIWVLDPLDASWPVAEVMSWPDVYRPLLSRTCFMSEGLVVQPWDHARYMNHACEPNCGGHDQRFRVALRDISSGEQLTEDYDGFGLPNEPSFACACGAAACRGRDVFQSSAGARQLLRRACLEALADARCLPQPLAEFLQPGLLDQWLASDGAR